MIGAEHERARVAPSAGFADAVTFSWADVERGWFGLARLGLSVSGEGGERQGSALAVLFHERDSLAAIARGGIAVPADADFSSLELPGVRTSVVEPLERWTVAFDGDDGAGFALEVEAVSAPAELAGAEAVARLGGMEGYEQLCRVRGHVVTADGETVEVDGPGQRGHSWGAPDWGSLELARTVSVWLGEDAGGIALSSVRPAGAKGHDAEAVWATLVERGEPVRIDDARLSTTYDREGRQRRAGLELWIGEGTYPHRAAGEVLCGSTLDLGQLRLDLAFMRWHADGRSGVGRYDVLRRASL